MSVFFSKYFLKFKTKLNSRYPVFGMQFQSSRIFVAYSIIVIVLTMGPNLYPNDVK